MGESGERFTHLLFPTLTFSAGRSIVSSIVLRIVDVDGNTRGLNVSHGSRIIPFSNMDQGDAAIYQRPVASEEQASDVLIQEKKGRRR